MEARKLYPERGGGGSNVPKRGVDLLANSRDVLTDLYLTHSEFHEYDLFYPKIFDLQPCLTLILRLNMQTPTPNSSQSGTPVESK